MTTVGRPRGAVRKALAVTALAVFCGASSGLAWAQSPPPQLPPDWLGQQQAPRAQAAPVVVAVPVFTG